MHIFIRFIGVLNAAVWFGAAVFFTVAVGSRLFLLGDPGVLAASVLPGRVAEVILERYFILQQWCACIALLHVLVEYLYSGRRRGAPHGGVAGGAALCRIGGRLLCCSRRCTGFSGCATPVGRHRRRKPMRSALLGSSTGDPRWLICSRWRACSTTSGAWTRPLNEPRFSSFDKFRG